jgi:iron complex transport system ATP-binding protein
MAWSLHPDRQFLGQHGRLTRRKEPQSAALRCSILHDLNLAARYTDTRALMDGGAIVAWAAPGAIQTRRLLSDVFAVNLVVETSSSSGARSYCLRAGSP